MELTFLGTGAADGWPNPWCACPSCADARARAEQRRPTSALVDGVLLLDLAPGLPPGEVFLGGVHTVLLTHAHPDHCAPLALLARQWVRRSESLTVIGPESAVEACRPWVGPEDPVVFTVVEPGRTLQCGSHRVRTLPADHEVPTVLYDITGPDRRRLLYATDTGPLPEATLAAVGDARFDLLVMEQTFGDRLDHGTKHLDLATFPVQLQRLRSVGALTEHTDVLAVHLSHHNPPATVLAERLVEHGARLVADGTTVTADGTRTNFGGRGADVPADA